MRYFIVFTGIFLLASGFGCDKQQTTDIRITNLRCEYLSEPIGIDAVRPRLSWILESPQRGQKQTAYRILAASTRENLDNDTGDLWDTGMVPGNQSSQIIYAGDELVSRAHCFWKVCVWDAKGIKSAFSEPASWSMGLLSGDDWEGTWIALDSSKYPAHENDRNNGPPPPWLRKSFTIEKPVAQASVYVTSRGIFELHLNGERVGNDVFAPEWTDYNKRIQYRTYDVTSLVNEGSNAIGAVVGDGWYSGYLGLINNRGTYGFQNSLLLQLEIEYDDGTSQVITTDNTWRASDGPILLSDMFMGEDYDARKEMPGWDTAGFDDSAWAPAITVEKPAANLIAQPAEPVQVMEHLASQTVTEPKKGVYVFDLGQNIVGWARLKVQGEAGTKVTLRFAEMLNPDGTVYLTNLRSAKATDTYILKGGSEETYEPYFTFHGFRYVEVTGFPGVPGSEAITGCVVYSATPPAGSFECSNPMVNQLYSNIVWGQRGNFLSIPTDCPQRDERLGWMGDAQIFIKTSTYNMDVSAFFTKWMVDVEDAQSNEGAYSDISPNPGNSTDFLGAPGWGDAGIIVPWTIYRVYGDTRIIEKHWDSMERWMEYIVRDNPDYIRKNNLGNNYGDWLSIDADTPKDLLATAFWAYDASLMAKMAKVIGRSDDASKYEQITQNIRSAFRKNYIHPDGRVFPVEGISGEETGSVPSGHEFVAGIGETQTGYLLSLYMDILPEELRSKATEYLVEKIREKDWHLSTGFLGVRYLNPVLTATGYNDVAYRLLLQDTFPSWLYPVKNGATTIWERWDGWTEEKGFQDPGMNSFNHYSLGSVGEWLFEDVAGIGLDPVIPAYKHIIFHPHPGVGLDFTRAEYNSIHGKIESGWKKTGDAFELKVTVPVNTTATVYVPADEDSEVTEGGIPAEESEGVEFLQYENGCSVYSVGSGTYSFESTLSL